MNAIRLNQGHVNLASVPGTTTQIVTNKNLSANQIYSLSKNLTHYFLLMKKITLLISLQVLSNLANPDEFAFIESNMKYYESLYYFYYRNKLDKNRKYQLNNR